VFNIGPLSLYI